MGLCFVDSLSIGQHDSPRDTLDTLVPELYAPLSTGEVVRGRALVLGVRRCGLRSRLCHQLPVWWP